jgi:hypothetical protein
LGYPTEPQLGGDFWKSTPINESIVNIVARANLSIVDGEQQWDVLTKQREFRKASSNNATTWAFFTPISSFYLEVSSSTPQSE